MTHEEDKFYKINTPSQSHINTIASNLSSEDVGFRKIIKLVFNPLKAVYNDIKTKPTSLSNVKIDYVANYFYNHCYIPPTFHRGISGETIGLDKIYKDISTFDEDSGKNKIFYLLGDVGSGKTTAINYLISKMLRKDVDSNKIIFVRIDLEEHFGGSPDANKFTEIWLFKCIFIKLLKVLEKNIIIYPGTPEADLLKTIRGELNSKSIDVIPAAMYLENFFRKIRINSNRRLLLIIDNIDYICHKNDRDLFRSDLDTGEQTLYEGITNLVRKLTHDHEFGRLGNILLVMRNESYHILTEMPRFSLPAILTDDLVDAYTIKTLDWKDVLSSRYKLYEHITGYEKGSAVKFKYANLLDVIKKDITASSGSDSVILIDHLKNLTNHSLRDMMMFFTQYAWSGGKDKNNNNTLRFIHQYPVGLLTYMLGGKCLFHQFLS
ncbi:MAG: ATP-binding protein [Nitrospirae bacterium]|nr:ATP-binding protein [Nitrospirota bacterium]